jgi:hypothetical protein
MFVVKKGAKRFGSRIAQCLVLCMPAEKNILAVGFPASGAPERRADLASKKNPEIILHSKCFLEEFITKRRVNACLFLDGNF